MFTMKDIQNDNCAAHIEATSIFKECNTCAIPFNKDSYAIIKSFNLIGIMNCELIVYVVSLRYHVF